tara:strand:+ start:203 stop:2308 length:2106 start_codon:yes stop_codon:yes gene_type:complete
MANGRYAKAIQDASDIELDVDYILKKDVMPTNTAEELDESELIDMSSPTGSNWAAASQRIYETFRGDRDLKGRNMARGAREPQTPEEYAQWGIEFIGQMNHNFSSMAVNTVKLNGQDDMTKLAMHHLFQDYERLPGMSWNGTKRFFKGIATDPTTYIGLGTLGLGTLGVAGAKQMSKQGFSRFLQGSLNPKMLAAYEGAGYTGAFDLMRQNVDVQAGIQGEFDLGQTFGQAALGFGATRALAEGVDQVVKNAPAIAGAVRDSIDQLGQAADARTLERAQDTSVQLNTGVDPMPMIDETLSMIGRSVRPSTDEMKKVLDARSEQMKLAPAKRVQPRNDQPLFELDYQKTTAEQKPTPVPRAPEGKPLPKFNRGAKVIEMSDKIATVLANRAKPFVGTNVQFFYHTGPIIDKAVSLGIPEDRARTQLRKFAENYAATSPRTKTEDNLRSASLVTAKQKAGLNLSDMIGPGGDGINEKGYPMMIGPGGIHQRLVDDAAAGGFNFNTNPKPATFVENVAGNHAGVTADTHAIRAVFSAMNEIEPGSVPIQFIGGKTAAKTKELRAQYEADPSSLNVANMIDDTLASQKINGEPVQTEYAIFSDIYMNVAKKLGVQPAEAQSLSWFANGDKTGLGSAPKTIVELIDERVDVTAQALNQSKDEVFKKFMQGSIPLLSLGGVTLLDTGAAQTVMTQDDVTSVANASEL